VGGQGGQQNTLTCQVEKVLYLGSECEVLLRFGEELHTLIVQRSEVQGLGQTVQLVLPPEHLRVWAADGAAAAGSAPAAASLAEASSMGRH
jgi:hypothetical protein